MEKTPIEKLQSLPPHTWFPMEYFPSGEEIRHLYLGYESFGKVLLFGYGKADPDREMKIWSLDSVGYCGGDPSPTYTSETWDCGCWKDVVPSLFMVVPSPDIAIQTALWGRPIPEAVS